MAAHTDAVASSVKIKALSYNTRHTLSRYLNPKQSLPCKKTKLLRDYRGLACQIGFEPLDIQNFKESKNPTMEILDEWTRKPNSTIEKLIQFLENMGRFDILQDMSNFETDIKVYLKKKNERLQVENPIPLQINEVASDMERVSYNNCNILTCDDASTGGITYYDAYISFADEDIEFVKILYEKLSQEGFNLYFRSKDSLAGHFDYDVTLQIIKDRCHFVLVILSPDFLKCPACEVQTIFAAGLGYEERRRKIIPLLVQPCDMPLVLTILAKIDFTKPDPNNWSWNRLIWSLRNSGESRLPQTNFPLPRIEGGSNIAITFPPSTVQPITIGESADELFCETSREENSNSIISSTSKELKSKFRNLFYKRKKKSFVDNSAFSNGTSGFHSQSTGESNIDGKDGSNQNA